MPETFQNATITGRFGVFRPNINVKLVFSISSDLKSVSEKFRFRDGLAWRTRPNLKNKAAFSNFTGVGGVAEDLLLSLLLLALTQGRLSLKEATIKSIDSDHLSKWVKFNNIIFAIDAARIA